MSDFHVPNNTLFLPNITLFSIPIDVILTLSFRETAYFVLNEWNQSALESHFPKSLCSELIF